MPILMSTSIADVMASVYALASRSIRSDATASRSTTKPRSRNSEVASTESSLPAANVLNQSDILNERSNAALGGSPKLLNKQAPLGESAPSAGCGFQVLTLINQVPGG